MSSKIVAINTSYVDMSLTVYSDGALEVDYYGCDPYEDSRCVNELVYRDKVFELYKALKEVFENGTV